MRDMKLYLAGQWVQGHGTYKVCSPFDGRVVAEVARGGAQELETATAEADRAKPILAAIAPNERANILERSRQMILDSLEELATVICEEAGKPMRLARAEVERSADTFSEAAFVARHPETASYDLAGYPSGAQRLALVRRVPIGPILAITPFNFPLNLVAHKLAPAIAAGCPVVLKPASQTPSAALMLAAILQRAGLPPCALSVIPSRGSDVQILAEDDRFAMLTFTGSMEVGGLLRRLAWSRRVTLELGGNAAIVVNSDIEDIADIARRIATAAFAYAGQSCISVQRILVHEDVYMQMRRELIEATKNMRYGDPADPSVLCGPLIDSGNAERVESWIKQSTEGGGRCLSGGERSGNLIPPTLLEEVPSELPAVSDEVFGPVAVLDAFEDTSQALNMVNDSKYGLQTGIFSRDFAPVQLAWQKLEVGGIIHNDVPTWRSDPMPYGGVKGSGIGREGPLHTYREMTEDRLLVLNG